MSILRYTVQFGDTDMAGIVFYPNFYRWMDMATHHLFTSMGFPAAEMLKNKIGFPLLEAGCTFRSPVKFGDILDIHSYVETVKTKSFKVVHCFKRGDEVVAQGFEWRVFVDITEGGIVSRPIPPEILDAFNKESIPPDSFCAVNS